MASDNIEGQEIDLLIQELSAPPRKPTAAKPAPAAPAAAGLPAVPPPVRRSGFGATIQLIMPARSRKSFLSDISLPSLPSLESLSLISAPRGAAAVWLCVGLGVGLCSAMPYWPYPKGCSWWLLFYLFAVAMVVITGIWNARLTWAARLGVAHVVALGIVFWGITLAAEETLPRIGYAKTAAVWLCP